MTWLDCEDGINEARWERKMLKAPDGELGREYLVFGASRVKIVACDQGCVQVEECSTVDRERRWLDLATWRVLEQSGAVRNA